MAEEVEVALAAAVALEVGMPEGAAQLEAGVEPLVKVEAAQWVAQRAVRQPGVPLKAAQMCRRHTSRCTTS